MRVKICGITNAEDARVACDAGADALGFNFALEAKKRNRYIEPNDAAAIIDSLPPFVTTVAVCVNPSAKDIERYLKFVDFVQLHGEESADFAGRFGHGVIKAFRLSDDLSDTEVEAYTDASAWLLDAYHPVNRGGTGRTTDWPRAKRLAAGSKPVILAGGLTPDNVAEAIQQVHPYAVDTAGGVEREPGIKDHERIRAFIQDAKRSPLS